MTFDLNRIGLRILEEQAEKYLDERTEALRELAEQKAQSVSVARAKGLARTGQERDAQGVYRDVGYEKNDPGFVMFFHEVGTANHPATPHLRPALYELSVDD